MRDPKDEFTGTFAGEATPVAAQPATSASGLKPEHAAALSKYAVDPNKPVRPKKVRRRPTLTQLVVIASSCLVICIIAGALLVKLSPHKSIGQGAGDALLLAAIVFVFVLMRLYSRRRR